MNKVYSNNQYATQMYTKLTQNKQMINTKQRTTSLQMIQS